jgi:hypothetical protein
MASETWNPAKSHFTFSVNKYDSTKKYGAIMFGESMMEAKTTENCGAEACGTNQYFLTA